MIAAASKSVEVFRSTPALDLSVGLTCPYLIYYVGAEVMVRQSGLPPIAGLLAIGAIVGVVGRDGIALAGWWLAVAAQALHLGLNWQLVDNHVYLAFYWTLTIALARSPRSAWALVAMTMTLATLQKLRAAEYRDGTFFYFALLSDARFGFLSPLLGVDLIALSDHNRAALDALKANPPAGAAELVTSQPARLLAFARGFSWMVLAVEAVTAIVATAAAVVPRFERVAHAGLIAFVIGTYTFVPVGGFGAVLCLLGLAGLSGVSTRLKAVYVFLLGYVLFFADAVRDLWSWVFLG